MQELKAAGDLTALKRSDLQKLAKQHGVKANLKSDQLREALCKMLFPKKTAKTPQVASPAIQSKQRGLKTNALSKPLTPAAKPHTPKPLAKKLLNTKSLTPKVPTPKVQTPKVQTPKVQTPKVQTPKAQTPKVQTPRVQTPKAQTPKVAKRESVKEKRSQSPPEGERASKRQRRSTYDKAESVSVRDAASSSSQPEQREAGVQEMLAVMKDDMSDEQMKQSLINALDQKHKTITQKSDATKLPRFTGLNKTASKPVTPGNKNWERIHNKQFAAMQSIEEYMNKKRARNEQLSASMKKIQLMRNKMKSNVDNLKSYSTPPSVKKSAAKLIRNNKPSFSSPAARKFVPTVLSTSKANFNFTSTANKKTSTPAPVSNKPFAPTVTSVSKASFKFGSPAPRKSPRLSTSKEDLQKSTLNRSVTLTSKVTPFRFTGANTTLNSSINSTRGNITLNNSTLNSSSLQKPKFDLKASLSKGMSWKPHGGKLQPFSMNKSTTMESRPNVKDVQIKAKAGRRVAQQKQRAANRLDVQLQRRGIKN